MDPGKRTRAGRPLVSRETQLAALGYAILYASMWCTVSCTRHGPGSAVRLGRMFLVVQPCIILAVLYGINCASTGNPNVFAWMVAYFFMVLGLLLIVAAACK
jgi:hypothetical protein